MRKRLQATTAVMALAAAAFAAAPALAQHMGGGHGMAGGGGHAMAGGGGFHGSAGARPGGQSRAADGWRGGWGDRDHDGDGWRGGWRGGWGGWGGWRGWGCCGWGWGWGPGFYWGGYPWFWGGLGFATGVALAAPYYDSYDTYDYGYAAPSGADAPPPQGDGYNCTAWRWDPAQNKYVQVRSACN